MKVRLFYKLLAVMLAVSLVPIALLGHRLISIGQLGVETAILELHLNMAEQIAGDFRGYVDRVDGRMNLVMDAMRKLDLAAKQALLTSLVDTDPGFREISILSPGGREVVKVLAASRKGAGELRTYAADPAFLSAAASKRRTVRFYGSQGQAEIIFFYPFQSGMSFRAAVSLDGAAAIRELAMMGSTGFPVVVDSSGSPIAFPSGIDPAALAGISGWPVSKAALGALSSGSLEYEDAQGRSQIGAYAPLSEPGGAVIVQQSRDEAFRSALFMRQQAIYVILAFILAALAAAYLLSRQVTGPILELTRAAEKVAEGDFSRNVAINTRDELKDLGETFNNMVRQLKTYSEMQVERIIREQKNTEAVLFSTDDGIVMIDGASRVQLANRKARSVMGVSLDSAIEGRPLTDIITNPDVRAVVSEALNSHKDNFVKEIEVSQEHSRRFFRCVSAPIIEPDKVARLGTLVAFYDITLDKELERIKEEFLHSITHDLRNPMGAVKGFVEFLLKEIPGPVNEAQRKMLVSIDRASFRLLGMINNILDIAKMEAGKLELNLTPVNAKEMAAGVLELLGSLGHRKNIKFVLDAAGPVTITADGPLLERVFINLVGNAAKFSPENGTITLHIAEDAERLTAYVGDEGDGIPPEYLDRIFEKFEQVKGQKAGGTGLGLTICKHIVTAHLGRIWVESEQGKGAKFLFTVPKGLRKDESGSICL